MIRGQVQFTTKNIISIFPIPAIMAIGSINFLNTQERKLRKIILTAFAVAIAFALSACDQKVVENTAIGGAIGAAAGQAVWKKPVEGALVGGAIGAATAIKE